MRGFRWRTSPHIVHGDALETDWSELTAAGGVLLRLRQSAVYRTELPSFKGTAASRCAASDAGSRRSARAASPLDYVGAWFLKAGSYVSSGNGAHRLRCDQFDHPGRAGGPPLAASSSSEYKLEIDFAHRTFAWGSDARGVAHVHVVILGLDRRENTRGRRSACSAIPIWAESRRRAGHAAYSRPICLTVAASPTRI